MVLTKAQKRSMEQEVLAQCTRKQDDRQQLTNLMVATRKPLQSSLSSLMKTNSTTGSMVEQQTFTGELTGCRCGASLKLSVLRAATVMMMMRVRCRGLQLVTAMMVRLR